MSEERVDKAWQKQGLGKYSVAAILGTLRALQVACAEYSARRIAFTDLWTTYLANSTANGEEMTKEQNESLKLRGKELEDKSPISGPWPTKTSATCSSSLTPSARKPESISRTPASRS